MKYKHISLTVALVLIALSLGGFFYLEMMNIDCDQFSCIGFLIILLPMFLIGVALLLITLITIIANEVYRTIVKRKKIPHEID